VTFRERLLEFGDGKGLSGVLTAPARADARKPGVLLFNAGILHRIGAHRLNVKIARHVAEQGATALRFDLSGLGDSAPRGSGGDLLDATTRDIKAAIDRMAEATGLTRFVVIGLCSGADSGYRAALEDARISGLVLLDPYAYQSRSAKLERLAAKALDADRWKRAIGRAVGAIEPPPQKPAAAVGDREHPPIEEFGGALQSLAARGVDILILYTAFVAERLTKPAHFHEAFAAFDFRGKLVAEVNPAVDHTYTELKAQRALLTRIADWLETRAGV
jgi:pimeloyl-ACP methyl ester carboxylesterase